MIIKKYPVFHQFFTKVDLLPISKKKTNYLIPFFAKQCSIIDNGSKIPSFLHLKTDKFLLNITFTEKDIEKVIQNLDSYKLHGNDMISIRMIKICGKSSTNHLQKMLERGCFPNEWKKANVPDKQLLKNYRPISLLPICGKVLGRLLYRWLLHQLTYSHYSRNMQIIWLWLRSTGCISLYIESIWQSMAPRSSLKTMTNRYTG